MASPSRSVLVLLLVAFTLLVSTSIAQTSTTTTTTITTTTSNETAAQSFCELCRDKGNCAQAYKGTPGIFCGSWLSPASQRLPCCCPATAQCADAKSNFECKCKAAPATTKPPSSAAASIIVGSLLSAVVLVMAIVM